MGRNWEAESVDFVGLLVIIPRSVECSTNNLSSNRLYWLPMADTVDGGSTYQVSDGVLIKRLSSLHGVLGEQLIVKRLISGSRWCMRLIRNLICLGPTTSHRPSYSQ
jgi:hypothetical protein